MSGDTHDYPDHLPDGPAARRAAGLNPGNRFETGRFWSCGEAMDHFHRERVAARQPPGAACDGAEDSIDPDAARSSAAGQAEFPFDPQLPPRQVPLTVLPERTRTILNRVSPASDMPFDWTLNPYRGCEHGCIYCFARPYHEYLGFSCGLDFETKLMAKFEAPELLERELARPSWRGEPIVMSAITDIYQPLEHRLQLARRCLEILVAARQPVATLTKGALVLRDIDLWAELSHHQAGRVTITLVTLDDALAKQLEPRAASPARRLRVIRELVAAGVDVSVNVAPVIPGLTDTQIPAILEAVAEAGARRVAWAMLGLPWQVKALFTDWLERWRPESAAAVLAQIRQVHGGRLYDPALAVRRRGQGERAEQIAAMFSVFARRYGLNRDRQPLSAAAFRRPGPKGQMQLFA